ncbi:MAG TPA: hypothetical protein VIC33_13965 [Vicinamibacterales bacterium]|jgi:hypothetical protein
MADLHESAEPRLTSTHVVTHATGAGLVLSGAFAGIIGGVLMGLSASLYAASSGAGWSLPMQSVAGTFYGPMAYVGGPGVTAIGSVTFIAVAAVFGMIFAAITPHIYSGRTLFWLGIPYGVAVWAFMTYVMIPVFDATMWPRVMAVAVFWFFLHWIYGVFTGVFIPAFRRMLA